MRNIRPLVCIPLLEPAHRSTSLVSPAPVTMKRQPGKQFATTAGRRVGLVTLVTRDLRWKSAWMGEHREFVQRDVP
jgi:hypothetical protein